jgi:hypothetical protein
LGQTRRFDLMSITSDVPPTSDVSRPDWHFAFGPRADLGSQRIPFTAPTDGMLRVMRPV